MLYFVTSGRLRGNNINLSGPANERAYAQIRSRSIKKREQFVSDVHQTQISLSSASIWSSLGSVHITSIFVHVYSNIHTNLVHTDPKADHIDMKPIGLKFESHRRQT